MSVFSPNKRYVDIPNVAKTLPPNPLLKYTGSATAASSTQSQSIASSARRQAKLRRRLLFHDCRCIVTGNVWASLQVIHFINDVRGSKEQKAEVERILTRQCFAGLKSFKLNWMGNAALCEAKLHADLDTYGLFALVPPLEQLYDIQRQLIKHNAQWARRAEEIPGAPRELDTSKAPYVVTALELLVLYDEFLPEGQSLAILPGKFRSNDRSSLKTSELRSRHQRWYVHSGGGSLVDMNNNLLPAISGINNRLSGDKLSIFSIIINAASKIRCWQEYNEPSQLATHTRMPYLPEVISDIRELIFFTPPTFTNTVPEGMPISDPNDVTPTGSLSSGSMVPPIQRSLPVDGRSTPMDAREDADALAENDDDDEDGSNFDDSEDDDSDSEIGNAYDLTPEEVKILGHRASDGSLSPAERADNAMLLLGMARNYRRPQLGGYP